LENYLGTISQAVESEDDKEVTKIVKEALTSDVPATDILDDDQVVFVGHQRKVFLPPQESMFSNVSGSTRLK
jgi:hypothetical protein|tara:strand:+ start:131 stop:346 length:216 start_codon:yes stop_codon:yes gene_type:complete